jgi:hypothetical protein
MLIDRDLFSRSSCEYMQGFLWLPDDWGYVSRIKILI